VYFERQASRRKQLFREARRFLKGLLNAIHCFNYRNGESTESVWRVSRGGDRIPARPEEEHDREWFNSRKSTFEAKVRQPMIELVTAIHGEMLRSRRTTLANPRNCVYRIYRDTRFLEGQDPYKTYVSAFAAAQ